MIGQVWQAFAQIENHRFRVERMRFGVGERPSDLLAWRRVDTVASKQALI